LTAAGREERGPTPEVAAVPGKPKRLMPHIGVDFGGATATLEKARDRIDRACHALA